MRTHDLTILLDLVLTVEPAWESLRAELHQLTAFAVESRYPGETSDASEAKQSLETAVKVRQIARQSLGL